jgi:hypothetical protein
VSAGNRVDAVHRGRPQHPARSLTSEQVSADAADLRAGIGELASLVAGSLGLPESLAEVSTFAVHAIPGAGVTLLRLDRADNIVEVLVVDRHVVR